jgi:hypothetical protein
MDAFAITGVAAAREGGEPEWFRVQGAVGGNDAPPKLFPRIQVVKRETIADLIAGGRIVYVMRADAAALPDRARVHVDQEGRARIEAVTLGGPTATLDDLPRFAFAADASDADIERLQAIGRGQRDPAEDDPDPALERFLALGWVVEREDATLALTDIGRDLVRSRYM